MPRSTLSLESLSSPSPSPPPTEPALAPRKLPIPLDQPTTGLDSDSELSELTDEEQDATEKRTTTATAMPDREDDEGAGITGGSRSKSTSLRQGRPQRPSNRRGGRKKRSSIVPAPMWGWVENKTATIAQEEEEEDVADPPRAMEEEEDEEMRQEEEEELEGEEDDDEEDEDSERGPRRRMGPYMISRLPGIRRNHILPQLRRQPSSHDDDDDEGEDVADDPPAVNGTAAVDEEDDEEYGSGEDDPPYTARSTVSRGRPPGRSAGQLRSARVALPSTENTNNTETGNDSEAEEDDDEDNATTKNDTKAVVDEDDDDDDEEDVSDAEPVPAEDPESGNETVSEDEDGKESTVERPTTHISSSATSPSKLPKPVSPTATSHSVDATLILPKDIIPIAVTAAASSIMAGSSVLEPASPSPSSSASVSRASSRSPYVAPSAKASECADPDDDKETTSKTTRGKGKRKAPASDKAEAESHQSAAGNSKAKAKDLPPLDLDIEMREGDQDELDRSAGDIEVEEPSPDDDLEIESDLQPAHRAEALDVLATIELKFALLRERVYVEKMETLAWEEALVNDGSHPELIHLQKELRKRRDKRLELASRKRTYETVNVTKRRRVDEEATWSWWKVARDELQTDMISETNRKRRRLERERRAVERPQPVRRIPNPPTETLPPPSLRKIVKNFPFNSRRKTDYLHPGPKQLIYPELSTLSSDDIANDLNFLNQNRRHSYESHRHSTVNMNVQMAPPLHSIDYNQHGGEIPGGFGGVNRLPPPPQLVQYQHHGPSPGGNAPPHSSYSSYNGSSGRHHPPSNPPPNVHNHSHNHNPYPNDHEMGGIVNGPAHQGHQLLPHHPYFGSGSAGGPANVYPPIAQHNGRRSISPVNLMPNGSGKQNGTWMGAGMGMGGFHSTPKSDWMDPRRNELDDEERALRERDKRERELRERDLRDRGHRERDHRDREAHEMELERQREQYHMQQHLHRQPPPSSGHPHLHQGPPPPPIPHHHHHRAHHHHVVHHHHGQSQSGHGSSSLPPGGPILDYDDGRPHSGHSHPAEVINISSSKSIPSHLKGDEHHPPSDYRDGRRQHTRHPSGPEDRERPLATPFVMGSSHPSNVHLNGTSSPRPTWNPSEENSFRMSSSSSAPAGYLSAHDGPTHSPSHRYTNSTGAHLGRGPPPVSSSSLQNSVGLSPPRNRPLPPPSPSASSSNYPNPSSHHSPRYGPPPPSNRSPVNLKMRPPSPLSSKLNAGPPSVYNPSPVGLAGPGRTSTPTGHHPSSGSHILSDMKNGTAPPYPITSRTASPLTAFPPTSSHPNIATVLSGRPSTNGADRDRERERDRDRHISPRVGMLPPPPSKLSVPQLVDGH